MPAVVDATQRAEGAASDWANEPLQERHASLIPHTERPYNAEPPNEALTYMITPETKHYRRQHTPVPLINNLNEAKVTIGFEEHFKNGKGLFHFSQPELEKKFGETARDIAVTLMCTGNRRSEFNNKTDGETMGLPWKNGSISTATWSGCYLADVLRACDLTPENTTGNGYFFLTMQGIEDYHVSVPLDKVWKRDGDCMIVWKMNGQPLPRDHGYPLRVMIPGFVGARSVKWIKNISVCKQETDGMHQRGIAYKQLGPNHKALSAVTKEYIESMPPIDHVPVTSAITYPEPETIVQPGERLELKGYGYSGAGLCIIRVDISMDGGATWSQADIERADSTQTIRSNRAWAWVQWSKTITIPEGNGPLKRNDMNNNVT